MLFALGVVASALIATGSLNAQQPGDAAAAAGAAAGSSPAAPQTATPAAAQLSPEAEALRKALSALAAGLTEADRNEHAALSSFYELRGFAPLWLTPAGAPTSKALDVAAEIKRADEWGLDAGDFALPAGIEKRGAEGSAATAEAIAADEIKISLAVLKYGRYARGGRIANPSEQLSTYLDRQPQLLKPEAILDGIAAADRPEAYLRGLNPAHPQFEKTPPEISGPPRCA